MPPRSTARYAIRIDPIVYVDYLSYHRIDGT